MRSGVYVVNEPQPDAESSSMSQPDYETPVHPDQVITDNMESDNPAQAPVTQESAETVPVENENLVTGPETVEDTAETPPEQDQDVETDELDAPIAEQESVGDMQVPPPSPNEDAEEETKVRIEDLDQTEPEVVLEDVVTESKEDAALVPAEPQGQSTPKPKKKRKGPSRPRWTLPSVYRSSLVKLLCGLYALVVVVLGIVFATATSLTNQERVHLYYLEVFLVYLYTVSLLILIYFQIGLLRGVKVKNSYFDTNIKISVRQDGSIQKSSSPTATPTPHRAHEVMNDVTLENGEELSLASRHSQLVLPADGGVAHVGEGINFYLRLGALAFAFGSVTLDGLHIASYFESPATKDCKSVIFILVYVMHLLFTFVQTFFLFKNHKLVIDKQKAFVRFGMMHIMATNLCVLLVAAITETAEDYRQQDFKLKNITYFPGELKSCYEDVTLARSASPYLFPCTIIYSIIAAGIVYRLYQYVGVKVKQKWPSHTSLTSSVPQGATGIDCDKANKGLFFGLLIAVLTLIAIATFFVFETRISDSLTAIQVFYVTEIALMAVTAGGIIMGYMRLSKLKFLPSYFLSVDSVLLIVALAGSYIYLCFLLISAVSGGDFSEAIGILLIITIILGILQITLQIVFILDGLCRCAENDVQMSEKPGRSVVTFLLVCNLAMWVVSMFEVVKTRVVPLHESFYGVLAWNIVTHLCVPLLIFFRFHSAICLSKIWYNAYQKEKPT